MFPVSDVEISVKPSEVWTQPVEPGGEGWQELAFELFRIRQRDQPDDDVYYYGVFNPRDSLDEYCPLSCMVGLTVFNDDPPDTGRIDLRLALGVGFGEIAATTATHELGHAHGLRHAPCGDGIDPGSIDEGYPHDGGMIGVWGYDIVSGTLRSPAEHSDVMGYCPKQWISDYNFARLFQRGESIAGASRLAPQREVADYEVIGVDGTGRVQWATVSVPKSIVRGRPISVNLASGTHAPVETPGQFFSYDHLPGGWVLAPRRSWSASRAEFSLDNRKIVAVR